MVVPTKLQQPPILRYSAVVVSKSQKTDEPFRTHFLTTQLDKERSIRSTTPPPEAEQHSTTLPPTIGATMPPPHLSKEICNYASHLSVQLCVSLVERDLQTIVLEQRHPRPRGKAENPPRCASTRNRTILCRRTPGWVFVGRNKASAIVASAEIKRNGITCPSTDFFANL